MAKAYLDKDGLLYFLQLIRPNATPSMDGTASTGTAKRFALQDHVHPSDTTKAPLASPALTGTPTAPTAPTGTSTTQIATTEFVANTVGAMTSGVSDVKVDGTSVVTSGVANVNSFGGAKSSSAGTAGVVPAPHSGGTDAVIFGNAQWGELKLTLSNNSTITLQRRKRGSDGTWTSWANLATGITIAGATTSLGGLLSSTDKTKLDKLVFDGNNLIDSSILPSYVDDVTYNATNRKIQRTKNGSSSDVVTLASVATSGSYNDLSNKPTIPSGVEKSTTTPKMDGTASVGSETKYAAGDHVHPSDTSRVPTTRKINGFDLTTDRNIITETGTVTTGGHVLSIYTNETDVVHGHDVYDKDAVDGMFTYANTTIAQTFVPKTTTVNGNALSGDITLDADDVSAIPTSAKGAASGVCPLDANSKVASQYLPSYVDDVIEAYPVSGATALSAGWLSATSGGSALTPESGKIYVLMADSGDYSANSQFRWGGSAYVKLNDGGVSSITNAEIDTIVAS